VAGSDIHGAGLWEPAPQVQPPTPGHLLALTSI
jgi:hypothetical protein